MVIRHDNRGLRPPDHEARILAHMRRVQAELAVIDAAPWRGAYRGPLSRKKIAEIRRLRRSGLGYAKLAKAAGVSEKTARKYGEKV